MENIPRTHKDIEAHIREIQLKRKEITVKNNEKRPSLSHSGFYDSEIYDGGDSKRKYEGYATSIAANDEDDEDDDVGYSQKRAGWGAPVAFFNDVARSAEDHDPFAHKRRPTIADREDEYRLRRLRAVLSPERVDPFAEENPTPPPPKRNSRTQRKRDTRRHPWSVRNPRSRHSKSSNSRS